MTVLYEADVQTHLDELESVPAQVIDMWEKAIQD